MNKAMRTGANPGGNMKEFIFITHEGTTESPTGKHVENIQVLGFAHGEDWQEARSNLLKENSWIEEAGFSMENVQAIEVFRNGSLQEKTLLDITNDLNTVIDYLWNDEKKHYAETYDIDLDLDENRDAPEIQINEHIFSVLYRLRKALHAPSLRKHHPV
jgi:DNA-binding ferritin-like protein (Dps family)